MLSCPRETGAHQEKRCAVRAGRLLGPVAPPVPRCGQWRPASRVSPDPVNRGEPGRERARHTTPRLLPASRSGDGSNRPPPAVCSVSVSDPSPRGYGAGLLLPANPGEAATGTARTPFLRRLSEFTDSAEITTLSWLPGEGGSMEIDASTIFALGLCLVFTGGFVWAEMHSRRRNRQPKPTRSGS